jgi:hypothetical protein
MGTFQRYELNPVCFNRARGRTGGACRGPKQRKQPHRRETPARAGSSPLTPALKRSEDLASSREASGEIPPAYSPELHAAIGNERT